MSLDALGSTTTCQNSIRSLRTRGRHVQVGLMMADDAMPPVPMGYVIAAELELFGSHGMPAHAYPDMLSEILDGTLAPQRLVSRRIPLAQAPEALAGVDTQPSTGVTMVIPGDIPGQC